MMLFYSLFFFFFKENGTHRDLHSSPTRRSPDLRFLDKLADNRLIAIGQDASSDERVIEVTHEALIRGWPRLHEWIYEDRDRKSTRLNSSHANISYAVFCLKKKKN